METKSEHSVFGALSNEQQVRLQELGKHIHDDNVYHNVES